MEKNDMVHKMLHELSNVHDVQYMYMQMWCGRYYSYRLESWVVPLHLSNNSSYLLMHSTYRVVNILDCSYRANLCYL